MEQERDDGRERRTSASHRAQCTRAHCAERQKISRAAGPQSRRGYPPRVESLHAGLPQPAPAQRP
jgi:hypothetical protein